MIYKYSEKIAAEERYLLGQLAIIRQSYEQAAKPYVDRLVALRSRSLPQMIVSIDEARGLGFDVANYTTPADSSAR